MALGDSYATLAELKAYMFQSLQDSDTYDGTLTDALSSVSREIESYCGRQFNRADTPTLRTFGPEAVFTVRESGTMRQWAEVHDFYDASGLVIESGGITWSPSDYTLHPRNGVVDGQPGWPYWEIHAAASLRFDPEGLSVTTKWGWASVQPPVKQASLILAAETFQIKDAPFGVAGSDQFGVIRVRDNRMAASKLAPYRLDPIQVG